MERELPLSPRTGPQGTALLGLLAQLALLDRAAALPSPHSSPSPPSFAEGMGRWLGWKDAIALSAVLQAPRGLAAGALVAGARTPAAGLAALEREFQRVQSALGQAIDDDRATAQENGSDFLPFRRRCFNLQQAMETATAALRQRLRSALAQVSPPMAQLAALDAVMASTLAAREQAQLAQLPVLLERHFTRLRQAGTETPQDTPWLNRFRQDMRRLLLAERDLRLLPAQGLLDTLLGTPQGLHE